MFKGTYNHRIDPKGRLPVPAAFRRALAEGGSVDLVATPLDQCVACYPRQEWEKLEAQLAALPAFSRQVKALTRMLASRAVDCSLDVQGRILLPSALRAPAGLTQDVLVVGVLNRFEVWAPDAWSEFVRESERLLEDVSLGVEWPLPPPAAAPETTVRPQAKPKR